MNDSPTMDDYLDGNGPESPDTEVDVPDDYQPHSCDHCDRSFEDFGVRTSKVLRKHEQRCKERDSQ